MSRKRRSKRYSKHSNTHIIRNMYRKKHKKTQRGGGALNYGKHYAKSGNPGEVHLPFPVGVSAPTEGFFKLKTRSGELLKVDMPADFLPPGWKKVGGDNGKEYVVTPDCSYIYPSESKNLKETLEYNYKKLMLEKHSKLSPKSPKLPTLRESPTPPK